MIPAFSPRREGDLGIGDTLALRQWIDWASEHLVAFIQLLPINENGANESPYSAISSTALDPIYLAFDQDEIPGISKSDVSTARTQLGSSLDAEKIDSQIIVPADHTVVHQHPLAILEVRRILLEHVAHLQQRPIASQQIERLPLAIAQRASKRIEAFRFAA